MLFVYPFLIFSTLRRIIKKNFIFRCAVRLGVVYYGYIIALSEVIYNEKEL